jgi:transcription initiation factor TFIID subunit 3
MTTPPSLFHALLRPSILQILRSTGYHSTRPAVLDSLTDLAARYLSLLCQSTADHAAHNQGDSADFTIVDIRMALQDAGALMPERLPAEELFHDKEDLRGLEEFIAWFAGQRMKEMMDVGSGDGEMDATDYLNGESCCIGVSADDVLMIVMQLLRRSTAKRAKTPSTTERF